MPRHCLRAAISTRRRPSRCTRRPATPCSPRSTRGGPIPPRATPRHGGPGAARRRAGVGGRRCSAHVRTRSSFTSSGTQAGRTSRSPGSPAGVRGPGAGCWPPPSSTRASCTPPGPLPGDAARARRRRRAGSRRPRRAAPPSPPSGDVALVALQSANHEVGTRQPVGRRGRPRSAHGVPLLVDAAQTVGRDALPRRTGRCSPRARTSGAARPASASWPSAPARAGARPPRTTRARRGRVPGFVDVPAVVAAAAALEAVEREPRCRVRAARDARRPHPDPCARARAGHRRARRPASTGSRTS